MSTSGQHLPSGREPGAQTREAKKRWRAAEWFGYPAAFLFFGGGVVLLFLAVRTGFDGPTYAVLKIAITGACALLCLWLGLVFLGRLVKRPLKGVSLEIVPAEVQRGESVRARVVSASEATPPRLLVGLVGSEHWEDDRGETTLTRKSVEWEHWLEVDLGEGEQHVEFMVPGDGPFSYEGTLVSLSWAVAAAVPRLWSSSRMETPLWVLP